MALTEKDMEDLIAKEPEIFIEPGLKLLGRQVYKHGRRFDLLFQDKFERLLLVEIKKGVVTREAVGQILEYYGLPKQEQTAPIELMLIGNVIPSERRIALEHTGVVVKEIPESVFLTALPKDDQPDAAATLDNARREKSPGGSPTMATDDSTIVAIGAVIDPNIQIFYEHYKKEGGLWVGWTYKNIQSVEGQLRRQIERDGYFILYGYQPTKRGGKGKIQWRLRVDDLEVFHERRRFDNPVLPNDPRLHYSKLHYQSIERDDIELSQFFDVVRNRQLTTTDAQRLLSSFIIARSPSETPATPTVAMVTTKSVSLISK
jgi:hypothetical protein